MKNEIIGFMEGDKDLSEYFTTNQYHESELYDSGHDDEDDDLEELVDNYEVIYLEK